MSELRSRIQIKVHIIKNRGYRWQEQWYLDSILKYDGPNVFFAFEQLV